MYFLTWGRVQDAVETERVEALVARYAKRVTPAKDTVVDVEVCKSLIEARDAPYFFEAFFELCQAKIPSGWLYPLWRRRLASRMERGQGIWFLGLPTDLE